MNEIVYAKIEIKIIIAELLKSNITIDYLFKCVQKIHFICISK